MIKCLSKQSHTTIKKVFEVEELYQTTVPEDKSKIVHIVITIRTSKVMIVDEFSQMCDDKQSNDKIGSCKYRRQSIF
jgi:uncharacterized glyoxalase superfamily protein PhnB